MTESELYAGIATTLLDKFAGRIIKGLTDPVKKAWEQFKIDFDIVFRDYLKNSVEKYGKIKTILYRTEPKLLNEFFECPNLRKGRSTIVSGESIDDLLDISHFLIIEGTGGIGKSTFLKYVFLKEVSKRECFIYSMANHYRNRSQVCLERSAKAEKRLLDLLTNKFGKSLGERVEMSSLDDKEVYSLFKSTWIGEQLNTMAKLRETLEHRRRRETQDLFGFLDG